MPILDIVSGVESGVRGQARDFQTNVRNIPGNLERQLRSSVRSGAERLRRSAQASIVRAINSSSVVQGINRIVDSINETFDFAGLRLNHFSVGGGTGRVSEIPIDANSPHAVESPAFLPEPLTTQWWIAMLPGRLPPAYVKEVTIPITDVAVDPYHQRHLKRYDPGFTDVPNLTIEFYDDIHVNIMNYIMTWRNLVVDTRPPWSVRDDGYHDRVWGYYGLPAEYKFNIRIFRCDSRGRPRVLYDCNGCWPASIDAQNFTSSSAEISTITVNFSADIINVLLPNDRT